MSSTHPRILGCERVDRTWEDQEAEQRAEAFKDERRRLTASLKQAQRELPLHTRLERAVTQITALQAGATLRIGRSSRSSDNDQAPPDASTLNVDRHLRVIKARVGEIEHELLTYLGLDADRQTGRMHSFEKDKMICSREFEGMRPEDISEAYPFLGSPRTIRRVRSDGGLRGVDGTPKPPELKRAA